MKIKENKVYGFFNYTDISVSFFKKGRTIANEHYLAIQKVATNIKKSKNNLTFSSGGAHYSEQTDHFVIRNLRYRKRCRIHH